MKAWAHERFKQTVKACAFYCWAEKCARTLVVVMSVLTNEHTGATVTLGNKNADPNRHTSSSENTIKFILKRRRWRNKSQKTVTYKFTRKNYVIMYMHVYECGCVGVCA